MSNTSTNYAELNVTNDDMKEVLAEEPQEQEPVAAEAAPKKKKNVGYRILALILAIAPIVCLCLLPFKLLVNTTAGYALYGEKTFLDVILALFKKNGIADFYAEVAKVIPAAASSGFDAYKFMGLPLIAGSGTVAKGMSLLLYAFPVAMLLTVVFMIVALFSGKAAPAMTKAIALVNFWVYAGYAAALLVVSLYYNSIAKTLDILLIAIAGASFLIYLVLSFIKAGKGTWMTLLLFLLTAAFAGVCAYGVSQCATDLMTLFDSTKSSFINGVTEGTFYKYAVAGLCGVGTLAVALSSIRLATKKGYTFDLIRYILQLLVCGALLYFVFTVKAFDKFMLYAIIAAAISLVQMILVIIVLCARKKVKKAAKAEETEETEETAEVETEQTLPIEESTEEAPQEESITAEEQPAEAAEEPAEPEAGVYAEAVRYDGYPAEEPAPEAEELAAPAEQQPAPAAEAASQPAPVYNYNFTAPAAAQPMGTAEYDFYNSRSFDPFIASLNAEEREQFTEIFILKYKGETRNLPDYQVGGENTEFFRKVFIYLGQYRDRIPDSLLSKMYQFAIRK